MEKKFVKLEEALKDVEVKAEKSEINMVEQVSKNYGGNEGYECWINWKCRDHCECEEDYVCWDYEPGHSCPGHSCPGFCHQH